LPTDWKPWLVERVTGPDRRVKPLRLTRRGSGCGRHVGQLILRDPAYRLWFDAEHGLVPVILVEVGEQFECDT
jgi:hypothetical protein